MAQKFSFEDLRLSGELNKGDAIRFLTKASLAGMKITPIPRIIIGTPSTNPSQIDAICQAEQYVGREHFEDYAAKYEPAMSRNNVGRIFNAAVRSGIPSDTTRRRRQVISGPSVTVAHRNGVRLLDYVAIAGEGAYNMDQASLVLARTYAVQAQSLIDRVATVFQHSSVADEFLDTLGIVLEEQCQWPKGDITKS